MPEIMTLDDCNKYEFYIEIYEFVEDIDRITNFEAKVISYFLFLIPLITRTRFNMFICYISSGRLIITVITPKR
jgi:hypothetical protein